MDGQVVPQFGMAMGTRPFHYLRPRYWHFLGLRYEVKFIHSRPAVMATLFQMLFAFH